MARLAAALWSLCVTAVLVTSATQGRCCCGPQLGRAVQCGNASRPSVRDHSPQPSQTSAEPGQGDSEMAAPAPPQALWPPGTGWRPCEPPLFCLESVCL